MLHAIELRIRTANNIVVVLETVQRDLQALGRRTMQGLGIFEGFSMAYKATINDDAYHALDLL